MGKSSDLELRRRSRLRAPRSNHDAAWLQQHVAELTAQQERNQPKPWAPSDAPDTFINAMVRGIVGFRFVITRLEGKWKMNQNRGAQDRLGVAKGLSERGRADDLEMADLVARSIAGND
jgi:transcriptional regulator